MEKPKNTIIYISWIFSLTVSLRDFFTIDNDKSYISLEVPDVYGNLRWIGSLWTFYLTRMLLYLYSPSLHLCCLSTTVFIVSERDKNRRLNILERIRLITSSTNYYRRYYYQNYHFYRTFEDDTVCDPVRTKFVTEYIISVL